MMGTRARYLNMSTAVNKKNSKSKSITLWAPIEAKLMQNTDSDQRIEEIEGYKSSVKWYESIDKDVVDCNEKC